MPGRKRRSKGSDGTAEYNTSARGDSGGGAPMGGAYSGDIRFHPDMITKPAQPPVVVNGLTFHQFGNIGPRTEQINAVIRQMMFTPYGFHRVNQDMSNPGSVERSAYVSNANGHIAEMWDRAYAQLLRLGEARDGYSQIPRDLHYKRSFMVYMFQYGVALAALRYVAQWKELSWWDDSTRSAAREVDKVSNARLDQTIKRLTSVPMIPAWHQLWLQMYSANVDVYHEMVYWAKPATISDFSEHKPSSDDYIAVPFGLQVGGTTGTGGQHSYPFQTGYFTQIMDGVDAYVESVSVGGKARYATDADSAEKINVNEDVDAIRKLFDMLNIPSNPEKFDTIKTPDYDGGDNILRSLYQGNMGRKITVTSGTDQILTYPTTKETLGYIELLCDSQPNAADIMGLYGCVYKDVDRRVDVNTAHNRYGFMLDGHGLTFTTNNPTENQEREVGQYDKCAIYSRDDGWINATTEQDQGSHAGAPWVNHAWSAIQRWTHTESSYKVRNGRPVAYDYFVPVEEIQYMQLQFISELLGIPYVG